MIKCFFLIILLFIFSSCAEEIPSYDTLSPDEQAYINSIARERCLANTLTDFTDFKTSSNLALLDFQRGQYWKIVYTSGSTTTTSYINVWKVTATDAYFLYKHLSEGVLTYYFIKMNTSLNGQMVDDLRIKKCAKDTSITGVTGTPTTMEISILDKASTEESINYKTDYTYTSTINSGNHQPMFFAYLAKTIAKKKLDSSGSVTSTESFTYALTYVGDDDNQLELTYNHANYSNQKFCVIDYDLAVPLTFDLPYKLNCVTSDAANVNTGGDADADFTPNAELIAPF